MIAAWIGLGIVIAFMLFVILACLIVGGRADDYNAWRDTEFPNEKEKRKND